MRCSKHGREAGKTWWLQNVTCAGITQKCVTTKCFEKNARPCSLCLALTDFPNRRAELLSWWGRTRLCATGNRDYVRMSKVSNTKSNGSWERMWIIAIFYVDSFNFCHQAASELGSQIIYWFICFARGSTTSHLKAVLRTWTLIFRMLSNTLGCVSLSS
jgi:hypothetical protein